MILIFYRWTFLLGLFLTGCGTLYKPQNIYINNPNFGAYAQSYLEYKVEFLGTKKVNYPINIQYSHLEYPIIGLCSYSSNPYVTRVIKIDYTYWQSASDEVRLRLLFHELGHCDLNCPHQEKEFGTMNEHISHGRLDNEEIRALFQECK